MSEKIQLPIDLQELCFIFEDSSSEHRSYLDLETGEIIRIFDDITDSDEKVMERVNEWLEEEGVEIIPQKSIEIREITLREISELKEIEVAWKGFGARGCLDCENEDEFKERYFVISRCPDSKEEEDWLDETLKKKYGVKKYGIAAGVFNDNRGLITSAVCEKCGSHNIFFDF